MAGNGNVRYNMAGNGNVVKDVRYNMAGNRNVVKGVGKTWREMGILLRM